MDREGRSTRQGGEARAPEAASFSGGSGHRAAIVSVHRRVSGTQGLYTARAVATDGGEVTVEIRGSTLGFSSLTSGTFRGHGHRHRRGEPRTFRLPPARAT